MHQLAEEVKLDIWNDSPFNFSSYLPHFEGVYK